MPKSIAPEFETANPANTKPNSSQEQQKNNLTSTISSPVLCAKPVPEPHSQHANLAAAVQTTCPQRHQRLHH